jgi:ferredoxin, 2Fe-2S
LVKITYVQPDGSTQTVDGLAGHNVMETAIKNDIAGIIAECGGACACATCRVFVDGPWREVTGEPSEMEREMLEFAEEANESARLSCQMTISNDFDGLVVRVPASQQ